MAAKAAIMMAALNKLCKWRSVLTGWQLGTRAMNDPESAAVRDQQDGRLVARAELTALTGLLLAKGVFTEAEFQDAVATEAMHLDAMFEKQFPGFSTTEVGITMDVPRANETMKRLRFKP